jgi:threonine dehydratase
MNVDAVQLPDKKSIITASERTKPYLHLTPVLTSAILNQLTQAKLYFKCENFQKAGAFKSRGAVNAIFSLSEKELLQGVCTHSSGNHAAALARAAAIRNTTAYIVMPDNSSSVKINAVNHYKGKITFCKPTLASREETLAKIRLKTRAVEIHPYNDLRIISGQATAAKELIEQTEKLDIIIAPVGGGGLLSGSALAAHYFSPQTIVIAAEPTGADDAFRSFNSGRIIPSLNPNTIADGLLTSLGSLTFPIIQQFVSQIMVVSEESIITAMRLIWERMKIIIEPSSAVPFAAILENTGFFKNKKTGIILSGGNVDLTMTGKIFSK